MNKKVLSLILEEKVLKNLKKFAASEGISIEEYVIKVLEELLPYIEADGGFLEFVEIEHETNFVKVRLGGACSTCAMSAMTLKQGIEKKVMSEIPDCYGVIQVL